MSPRNNINNWLFYAKHIYKFIVMHTQGVQRPKPDVIIL